MKRQKDYSLTAKERKALRNGEDDGKTKDNAVIPAEPEVAGDTATVADNGMSKKNLWIMITGIVLAVIIIVGGILLLVLYPRTSSKYPRATFELSNGKKITMEIWEEDCPIAATNFIFLAQIGFFDGTIVYDVQRERQYIRFGAFTGYGDNDSRYTDSDFISNIPQKMFDVSLLTNDSYKSKAEQESAKFGYRLYLDSGADAKRYSERGVVSFHNENAADFVINLGEGNTSFKFRNDSYSTNYLGAFGKFDDESLEILDSFMNPENYTESPYTGKDFVIGTDPVVTIKSVKIDNLDKKKWKNFEFISYMNTVRDGKEAWRNWVG